MAKKTTEQVTDDQQVDDELEQDEQETDEQDEEQDTIVYKRADLDKLRDDIAKYRTRANDYAKRLHTELVRGTGRLADPTDLAFDETHLDDADALTASLDALVESKPHLKTRNVTGDVNQGVRGENSEPTDFLGAIRQLL